MKNDLSFSFQNVSFSYSNIVCLNNISIDIQQGEFVSIVGQNGSGKTTFSLLCDALLQPNSGMIQAFGATVFPNPSKDAIFEVRSKIGYIMQNPDDCIVTDLVYDNVAFMLENLALPKDEIASRVNNALEKLGISELVNASVATLSGGQKQKVVIAGAIAIDPKALILDEPTSMLDPQSADILMKLLKELNGEGITIILITHNIDEAKCASRIIEFDNGKIAYDGSPSQYSNDLLFVPLSKLLFDNDQSTELEENADSIQIKLEDVSFAYEDNPYSKNEYSNNKSTSMNLQKTSSNYVINSINLDIYAGDFLSITGSNGSGKTTLIKLLNGLIIPSKGNVLVFGKNTSTKAGRNHARNIVGVCFQFPERQLFAPSVFEDVSFGPKCQSKTKEDIEMRAKEALRELDIPEYLWQRSPMSLSGGEQRKVAIAGILAMNPDVVVFDEPCAGLDPINRIRFLEILKKLNASGKTIVMVTHNIEEAKSLSNKIYSLDAIQSDINLS